MFQAIARELSLAHSAVKAETVSIYQKLGVSCRQDAVAEARRNGLLEAPLRTSEVLSVTRSKSHRTAARCEQVFSLARPGKPVAVAGRPVAEFDREDIFGVRRAGALLPDGGWDSFWDRWTEIGEGCGYHLPTIAVQASAECERWWSIDSVTAQAWWTISEAMTAYLDWRDASTGVIGRADLATTDATTTRP